MYWQQIYVGNIKFPRFFPSPQDKHYFHFDDVHYRLGDFAPPPSFPQSDLLPSKPESHILLGTKLNGDRYTILWYR